jgi:16S rRNA (uracil1498-N3)-methyltransferase
MTRRRWIADEVEGDHAVIVGSHADHLVRVLRAHVGQEFDVVAEGDVRSGKIVAVSDGRVEFTLGEKHVVRPSAHITLLLSVFKFDRMEWAIEKCTELGAASIVPVIATRTEKHLADAALKRVERWRRIVREAAEQSRRASAPEVANPCKLRNALEVPGTRILLAETERDIMLKDVLPAVGDVALAFGPIGGWTEAELELFREAGWVTASLGDTILRAETAAIAATAVVVNR